MTDGGGQLVVSFARNVSKFPTYTPNPDTYLQFAIPTMPILILAGTLDPNTEVIIIVIIIIIIIIVIMIDGGG